MQMIPGGVDREVLLNAEHFDIIRQLTFELSNIPQAPLIQLGWSLETKDFLKKLMYSVPREVGPAEQIRIVIVNEDVSNFTRPNIADLTVQEKGTPSDIIRYAPKSVADMWPHLLNAAVLALGDVEARYRTGYQLYQINNALRAFMT